MKIFIVVLGSLWLTGGLPHPPKQSDNDLRFNDTAIAEEEIVTFQTFRGCGTGKRDSKPSRKKRFAVQGSRWKVSPITYNISKYPVPSLLSREEVDQEIGMAFQIWEDIANLTFKKAREGKINIDIRFEAGNHGCDEAFDGRGGMTAHAFYPVFGGSIHFDANEEWTRSATQGINLFQVATHEIGHALGLEHSSVPGAVMNPYYYNYNANFRLHEDDIHGIRTLYGNRAYSVCDHSNIDAAITMVDDVTYLFKETLVYKLNNFESQVDPDYPKAISKVFEGLRGPIDAAFTRSNGISYFFKDDEFWRFSNMTVDFGFPKKIEEFFPRIPSELDAAVVFPVDESIYFMKGSYYWKFDPTRNPSVSSEYPKSITTDWHGIPDHLDAAVRRNEDGQAVVYLFKGNEYWRFNDRSLSVYLAEPPYPRPTKFFFQGCSGKRRV